MAGLGNVIAKYFAVGGILVYLLLSWVTGTFCWFQATIGVPCPGCGSTRAAQALLNLNFAEALFWHPLIILSVVVVPLVTIRYTVFRNKRHTALETKLMIGVTVVYVAVFVVRLITMFPHTAPMVMHHDTVWRMILRFIN